MSIRHIITGASLLPALVFTFTGLQAQEGGGTLTIAASVDAYAALYSDSLPSATFRPGTAISSRSEQFGLNMARIAASYAGERVRGSLALHYGDVALTSWPSDFNAVQEALVGVRVAEGFWIDGGFYPTHIGAEGFMPGANRISTLAAVTYYEPFFQSGLRGTWEVSEKFQAQLHVLNGYNNFVDRNDDKAAGLFLGYTASDDVYLSYANLIGSESADTLDPEHLRMYHNLVAKLTPSEAVPVTLGLDVAIETNADVETGTGSATAIGGLLGAGYRLASEWSVNARGEYFADPDGFLAGTFAVENGGSAGPTLFGATLGIEHRPAANAYVRLEGRMLRSNEKTLFFGDGLRDVRWEGSLTAGIAFNAAVAAP